MGGDLVAKWGNNTFGVENSLFPYPLTLLASFVFNDARDLVMSTFYSLTTDRKITIHSKEVSSQSWLSQNELNNMDQDYNWDATFWTCWRKLKNVSISSCYIFYLRSQVIAMCGNCSEEIPGRWQNSSCVNQMCLLGVKSKVSNRRTLSGGTYCIFTSCWLAHNQLQSVNFV